MKKEWELRRLIKSFGVLQKGSCPRTRMVTKESEKVGSTFQRKWKGELDRYGDAIFLEVKIRGKNEERATEGKGKRRE